MTFALPTSRILYVPRPGRLSAFVQSRLRPLDIEPDTVKHILAQYGLTSTAPGRNLPNARRNRNLIVQTSEGKKVLKLYRDDWQPTTIQFEHSILNKLAQLDAPGPRMCWTENGRTFIRHQNHHYALFDFIPGKTFTSSFLLRPHRLQLMKISGKTLAHLHRKLNGFQPEQHHHHGFGDYSDPRHRDMAWHKTKVNEFIIASRHLPSREEQKLADQLVKQSGTILSKLNQLDEQLNHAPLPRLVIHGDYGLHNLLFHDTNAATPIDFELSRLEWRLTDLVSCLSKLRYANGDHDFESMTAFMDGYRCEFPISDQEWQHFPDVWQFYRLMGAVQYWKSYFETKGPVRKLYSALDSIDQANWAIKNPEKILAIIRDRDRNS